MGEQIIFHKALRENNRWQELSFADRMANVGSEVSRACRWKHKGDAEKTFNAAARGLELLDMTIGCEQGCPDASCCV